ncbi:ATP-binding cassette, subfamily B [Rhodoblastus acidophilus]|uniref:ATP-binding cassette, subfamily B n=1 Tax=Rhodoblastus acidophilus TaxID=1074 RepID=A0A212QZQ1_RHOAC|nr:ABC transporter ATP-binding protein [Rhodoblastus acidophilus]PPQ40533.1 ABC transporter ATP-binding protein [Rhodoblastus acidophilus]RAI18631.1 ABC transporter ATP-binding protein [Rhodoblastus acidophilus]SNB65125.1 ATP-binding cassette, subfamily B [Rhodoblastus acidophilus]
MPTDLCHYRDRPLALIGRSIARRPVAHGFIVVAVLGAVFCSIGVQYGVKRLVDSLTGGPAGDPWPAYLLLVGFIAGDNLLWRAGGWIASSVFVRVTGDLRSDLFRHLTGHAPAYFADRLPGALTGRITAASNAVYQMETMFAWNVLPPCVATFGAIGFLASVNGTMAACVAAAAGLVMAAMLYGSAAGAPLHGAFADAAAKVDGEMVDVVGNMQLVRTFGAIGREHRRFDGAVADEMRARSRSLRYLETLRTAHALTVVAGTLALLAWAILLWRAGRASPGDVVLVCTLGLAVLSATRDLAVALVDVAQHFARLAEALRLLLSPHEMRDHPQASALVARGARMTFENVAFAYPGGAQVFEGFSLDIAPGQRVGLAGPSGGGKSTLAALAQRMYPLRQGRILIDGHDIAHATEDSLRAAIAFVPQDTALLNRTLMENIRYGRPDASDEEVWAAARAARCGGFIERLPAGLDTIVGDRGVKLSGGQRQRIAIARAFLKNAPLLIFDEATSALDGASEEAIRGAMETLMAGRTVIMIAHRIATLRAFDRILVLQSGRLVEDGAPDQLMARDGLYRRLVRDEIDRLNEKQSAA